MKKRPEYQDDRPSKGKIAYRRLKRFLRPFIFLVIIIGLFIGGGWFLVRIASDEQYSSIRDMVTRLLPMKITKIIITGCDITPESSVKNSLGIKLGDSIFNFSVQDAQARLNDLPFVENALLKRQLPNTIIIHITERHPFAIWQHHGKFMLIDKQGKIVNHKEITSIEGQDFLKLPLVVGVGANTSAAELLNILSSYPEVKKRMVAAVMVGNRRWNLDFKNGTVALLPENQELAAIQKLTQLQNTIQLLDRPVKDIDLRLPDRLVIRENKDIIDQSITNQDPSHTSSPQKNNP